MEIPDLTQKIDLLLLHHSSVRTRTALAGHLGVHPSNISLWQNGDGGHYLPDLMPDKHVVPFCELFDIEKDWLSLKDIEHFAALLIQNRRSHSAWQALLAHGVKGNAMAMHPAGPTNLQHRAMFMAEFEAMRERTFVQFQNTYISVDLEKLDPSLGQFPLYLTLIAVGSGFRCLCPSPYISEPLPRIDGPKVTVPLGAPSKYLILQEAGCQYLAGILTRQPMSEGVVADLKRAQPFDLQPTLEAMAKSLLQAPESSWRLLFWDYMVLATMPPNRS